MLLSALFQFLLNIFFWDADPKTNARYHGNKHVHKMIVEYAQIASTAYRLLVTDYEGDDIYKKTHATSNVVQWTAESSAHYDYVVSLGLALVEERERRRKLYHRICDRLVDRSAAEGSRGLQGGRIWKPPDGSGGVPLVVGLQDIYHQLDF